MGILSKLFGDNSAKSKKTDKKEEKKREWKDPDEQVKYVCQGAKIQCKYCNPPIAMLTVTAETIILQDKPWATVGDKDGKTNFSFAGVCMHPSQQKLMSPPPPCKSIISLGEWKDFSETVIGNHNALLVKSKIPCMISGEDLEIIHSGQMATLTKIDPLEEKDNTPVTLELTKVAFNTKFDICSDEVQDFDDYKNFWVLEDRGGYYHWLKKRNNPNDSKKPDNIPITFAGSDKIIFKATFEVTSKNCFQSAPFIRVTDKRGKYDFIVIKGKTQEEFEIRFESTNTPFNGKIGYIEVFELLFEYSQDGKQTWKEAGTCKNELYITWKQPGWNNFLAGNDQTSMQVKSKATRKEAILETLLWIGCKNGAGASEEEDIVDKIFEEFEDKKVLRRREGEYATANWLEQGLGYWRGKVYSDTNFDSLRSVRYLLREGEACCGEWTLFFQHILLAQGIVVSDPFFAIGTDENGRYPYKYQTHNDKVHSIIFAVAQAKFLVENGKIVINGKSAGQGNPTAQPYFSDHVWFHYNGQRFYDPSYGLSFSKEDSRLIEYCIRCITQIYGLNKLNGHPVIIDKETHNYLYTSKKEH